MSHLTPEERADFKEKFPGVLETKFQVESKEFPVPSITRFVEDEILQWIDHLLTIRDRELRVRIERGMCDEILARLNHRLNVLKQVGGSERISEIKTLIVDWGLNLQIPSLLTPNDETK